MGQYVDGVYYGRAQLARAPFFDLNRVEVLRGPQGILFGKNSIAGAVSMHTAKPTDEFEGSVTALYEPDHGERDLRLVLSGPITDDLSGRLAIMDRTIDGYYRNTTLDRDESEEDVGVIRGSLRWAATDDLTVDLKVENGSFDTTGRFMENQNPVGGSYGLILGVLSGGQYVLDTEQDFRRQSNGDWDNTDTENVTLSIEYALGENTLTSVTAFNAYDNEALCDCDFVGASLFTASLEESFEQLSQEFRLTSPIGDTFDYIVGAFFQTSELEFDDSVDFPVDSLALVANELPPSVFGNSASRRNYEQDADIWSVFAQVTWNLSDVARLTLGGRYTDEEKDASRRQFFVAGNGAELPIGTPFDPFNAVFGSLGYEPYPEIADSRSETAFTPLVTFQYDVSPDAMLYATYTTGFKSGGFDVRSNAHPDPAVNNAFSNVAAVAADPGNVAPAPNTGVFEYEEEEAESIELGGKFTLADGAAELNVALFRTEYTDLQTSQFDGILGFNVVNAGEATTQGLELDGRWRVSEGLTLMGSMGYLDFEYDSFTNAQCYFGQTPNSADNPGLCDVSGETREYTPELQGTLTADYVMPLGDGLELKATVDLIYSDDYFASNTLDPNLTQDSFTKINARLAVSSTEGTWDVALVGKNLTDEEVISFGGQVPLSTTLTAGAFGPAGAGTAYYAFYDRPMSIALQGTYRF